MVMESDNKRIAKNTIFLYLRSFLMMIIGLFSSRVILQALGVDDYGLYGAIGSIVAMFTIINGTLAVGTSRFLTFELGKGDKERLNKTFNASFTMHVLVAIALFIMMETIGLWFVNNKMSIPHGREFAANVVYQLSILSCMFSLTQVPYGATIIAHEKMDIYAYVGLSEAIVKLALIVLLLYAPFSDKLIAYAIVIALWSIALQIFYRVYCYKRFEETHLKLCKDKDIYKGMLSYSLWDMVGQFCATGNSQGINILINMFFGVAVNAARAVAYQVEGAVNQLASNFTTSVNPQIVKSYARGDMDRFFELIYESGKYSYYLMFLLALPIFLEAEYILNLWLVEVPEYAVLFLRFVICISLYTIFSRSVINGVHATGDVKTLNLTSGVYSAGTFIPMVYVAYKLGLPVWSCFVIQSFNRIICSMLEVRALCKQVKFDVLDYFKKVYLHAISVSAIAAVVPTLVFSMMPSSFLRLTITVVVSVLSTLLCVYTIGISRSMRLKINDMIVSKLFGRYI